MTIFSNFRDQLHLAQCFSTNTTRMPMASTCMDQPQGSFDKKLPVKCTLITSISLLAILKPPTSFTACFQDHFTSKSLLSWRNMHAYRRLCLYFVVDRPAKHTKFECRAISMCQWLYRPPL